MPEDVVSDGGIGDVLEYLVLSEDVYELSTVHPSLGYEAGVVENKLCLVPRRKGVKESLYVRNLDDAQFFFQCLVHD